MKKLILASSSLLAVFCTVTIVRAQTTYIESPQNVKVGYQDNGTVAISWDPSTTANIDSYIIYRDGSRYANVWNYSKNAWVQGATTKFALDLDAVDLNNGTSTRHKYQVLAHLKDSSRLDISQPNVAGSIIQVIDIPHNEIKLGDLVVTNIETIPANPSAYQDVGYKITIKNQGPGDVYVGEGATTPVEIIFSWGVGNPQSGYYYIPGDSVFSANKTYTFEVTSTNFYYEKPGEYKLSACVGCDINFQTGQIDFSKVSNKFFKETNYNNNEFSKNITIASPSNLSPVGSPTVVKIQEDGFYGLNAVTIHFVPPQSNDFKGVKLYRSEVLGSLGELLYQKDINIQELHSGVVGDFLSTNVIDMGDKEKGLLKGKTYYYTLRSYNRSGQESINTDQHLITINEEWKTRVSNDKTLPSLPQNVRLMSGFIDGKYAAHYIKWDNIKDEDLVSLKIYRSDTAGNLGEWIVNAAPFDVNNTYSGVYFNAYEAWEKNDVPKVILESGKIYYYTFESVDMAGNAQKSEQYPLKTIEYQLPSTNVTTTGPIIYDFSSDANQNNVPDQIETILISGVYFTGSNSGDLESKYQEYASAFGLNNINRKNPDPLPNRPHDGQTNNYLWYLTVGLITVILIAILLTIYFLRKRSLKNEDVITEDNTLPKI